jgi:hypothetical protein
MPLLVAFFGLFIATLGLIGIISPERLLRFAKPWQTPTGLYVAAAFRIVLGVALFLIAPDSRTPTLLRVLGAVIFVAGLATPFLGAERFHKLLDWWAGRSAALC